MWMPGIDNRARPLDAIVVTASGCGPVIRDYGYMLRDDPRYAAKAARVSALACDLCELLERIGLPPPYRCAAHHCRLSRGLLAAARAAGR